MRTFKDDAEDAAIWGSRPICLTSYHREMEKNMRLRTPVVEVGTEKVVKKFLLFPMMIPLKNGSKRFKEVRWLETVFVKQIFRDYSWWENIEFVENYEGIKHEV